MHIVGNLSGNIFTNNFIMQATGTLEFVGMWYLLLGRRFAISSAFIISGASSMVLVALPDNASKLSSILSLTTVFDPWKKKGVDRTG